ncbi:MAG TPA: MiaB/RimO family radical SAM methylthiotransferase, partial [Gemmatimonadaceae bacterium]
MIIASGGEIVSSAEDADVAVFNSCTVTSAAEADLRADVRSLARANPSARSVVMGCAAGAPARDESRAPLRTLPTVDSVIPGGDVSALAAALELPMSHSHASMQSGARALLRIQDGCDEHCTFCATTLSRGANRSRSADEIVREALTLADTHPEIVVTGIHIGTYGRDTSSSLSRLVERLILEVPDVRFRLTSIEATEVDDLLVDLFRSCSDRLAPHLHAPLQSGSNAVLRRMGRHWYTAESYAAAVERLAGIQPFALAADVISGFPGETEDDHRATVSLVESLPFTSLHVFPYSPRPNTAALKLGPAVSSAVAGKRARELRDIAEAKANAHAAARMGGNCDVVVIERHKGLTEDYLSVDVPESLPRRSRFRGILEEIDGRVVAHPLEAA